MVETTISSILALSHCLKRTKPGTKSLTKSLVNNKKIISKSSIQLLFSNRILSNKYNFYFIKTDFNILFDLRGKFSVVS